MHDQNNSISRGFNTFSELHRHQTGMQHTDTHVSKILKHIEQKKKLWKENIDESSIDPLQSWLAIFIFNLSKSSSSHTISVILAITDAC